MKLVGKYISKIDLNSRIQTLPVEVEIQWIPFRVNLMGIARNQA
jgi:hypothetical protein